MALATRNGYDVYFVEMTGFIRVRIVSPSKRSENEYYFFAGNGRELREREQTLADLFRDVS